MSETQERIFITADGDVDLKVCRLGYWSVAVIMVTAVAATMLPLDAPNGFSAEHSERLLWLHENRSRFIAAWVNQIVAMFSLSALFACTTWLGAAQHPIRATVSAIFIAMATMAFIVPKFIAVWSIPMLADSAASGGVQAEMANALLLLLNVSIPFSLYTSFDYLGFWLYAIFALMIAGPLYGASIGEKVAAGSLGLYGVLYQLLLIWLLMGGIAPDEIESYFMGASSFLLIHVVAMVFVFKTRSRAVNGMSFS